MAVCKMKHVTILCLQGQKDRILTTLQEFGGVEIVSGKSENAVIQPEQEEKQALLAQALRVAAEYQKKPSLLDQKNPKPSLTAAELERQVAGSGWETLAADFVQAQEELNALAQKQGSLQAERNRLLPWQSFSLTAGDRDASAAYSFAALSVSSQSLPGFLEELENRFGDSLYVETAHVQENAAGLLLIYPKKSEKALLSLLSRHNASWFEPLKGLTAAQGITALDEEAAELDQRKASLLEAQQERAGRISLLEYAQEYYDNLLLRKAQEQLLEQSASSLAIDGWLPAEQEDALCRTLESRLPLDSFYLAFDDVREDEIDDVPILLKNNRVFRAFENLTEMYSLPRYNEMDPTPVVAPFYMLFFGMMVADVGYGLVMLVALGAARFFLRRNEEMRRKTDFFYYLSFPVILWGLVYGSFFGVDLPFRLISPVDDIITVVILSLVIGWLQLVCGLMLNALGNFRNGDIWGGLSGGAAWLAFLVGAAMMVVAQMVFPSRVLFIIGVGLCVLAALGIVFIPMITDRSKLKGLAKGLYALYGVSAYVGDLVSYTRLMALGVAGASIAMAFNTIMAYLPLLVRVTVGVLVAIALHGLNMFLSMLGAYVHGLRLQFVEFFSKFFSGGGRKFRPFRASNRHITVKQETQH